MVISPSQEKPARAELLAWLRHNAPDLRIGHAIVDGKRAAFTRYAFGGLVYEHTAEGETADYDVVLAAANAMRSAFELPPIGEEHAVRKRERDIITASLAGNTERVEALARQLAIDNATDPRELHARIPFARRTFL